MSYGSVRFVCVLQKAQKTAAQFPSLQSLSSLGKNVPSAPYTHLLPPTAFDKGNGIARHTDR